MFKTIVVGCDGSEATLEAIALAEQLRDPEHGHLILVAVYPFYRNFAVAPLPYDDWLRGVAERDLKRAADKVTPGVPCETQSIASPSAAAGLDEVADTVNADLIVIGPSHHGTVGRVAGRTTVQRMLHAAPCALAVAGPRQALRAEGWITAAYDGSAESRFALSAAYAAATRLRSHVRICTAIEPIIYAAGFGGPIPPAFDREREQAARERLLALAAEAPAGVSVETKVQWGPPGEVLLELAGDDTILIVAGSRGYGPIRRLLAGGVSAHLLVNGEIPVLVTPRVAVASGEPPAAEVASAA